MWKFIPLIHLKYCTYGCHNLIKFANYLSPVKEKVHCTDSLIYICVTNPVKYQTKKQKSNVCIIFYVIIYFQLNYTLYGDDSQTNLQQRIIHFIHIVSAHLPVCLPVCLPACLLANWNSSLHFVMFQIPERL